MLTQRANAIASVAAATFAIFACWRLFVTPAHSIPVDGVALATFSALACASAASAALNHTGSRRRTWAALAVGLGGWVVGNLVWLYHVVVVTTDPAFPSIADVGFLMLPIAVVVASLSEVVASGISAVRPVLDGVLIAAAVFLVSWVFLHRDIADAAQPGPLIETAKLWYPTSDVVIVTMALLALSSMPAGGRRAAAVVTAGLTMIAVADIGWIYTQPHGDSAPAASVVGWLAGLLLISAAALRTHRTDTASVRIEPRRPLVALFWLPYLPVLLAVPAGMFQLWPIVQARPVLTAAAVLVLTAMGRQLVVLLDNRNLLATVGEQARCDPLTGLGNRLLFNDRLDAAMEERRREGSQVAVLALDLDDFKMVNDTLGHPVGDELLIEVAKRLRASVPAGQAVVRLGGDEFAILVQSAPQLLADIAQGVIEAFDTPFLLKGEEVFIHPSVGLATADDHPDVTAEDLLQRADIALYAAKRTGIGGVQTFNAAMQEDTALSSPERWSDSGRVRLSVNSSLQLLGPLRRAITDGELKLAYQPMVSLTTGEIVSVEALLRWPHPELGLLQPNRFLPLIRRNGMIGAVTDLVLHQAARDAATWYLDGTCKASVSVNLFAPSLSDVTLAERIWTVLAEHGLPPSALQVEITEQLLLGNLRRTQTVINQLRESGTRVAIDDFGSGYSTMGYLRDLPIDELKLDRKFVAPILHNPRAAAIVRSVIDLTRTLDVVSVAEGVEDHDTAERLASYGCNVAQGYYFAKPMFVEPLRILMRTRDTLWQPAIPLIDTDD